MNREAFYYRGEIPASKSLMNRALIIQSYEPSIILHGSSNCSDVAHMKSALRTLLEKSFAFCGEGGTTFRFLFLRASRLNIKTQIAAAPSLLARPQKELLNISKQMGVYIEPFSEGFNIQKGGWHEPVSALKVDRTISSQYLSSIILNSWGLGFPLKIQTMGEPRSEGYLQITLKMVRDFGLNIQQTKDGYLIAAAQIPRSREYRVESDVSSAFSVAAAGALFGEVELVNFPFETQQPDIAFVSFLNKMGVQIERHSNGGVESLVVKKRQPLTAISADIGNSPDLFPVLSVLCSFAEGTSRLFGAPHLIHKESDRISKTSELLNLVGIKNEPTSDGMIIHGGSPTLKHGKEFDPAHDHRIAMAAGLFQKSGIPIRLLHSHVVEKSFPEFWEVLKI